METLQQVMAIKAFITLYIEDEYGCHKDQLETGVIQEQITH
jgi:hypothetical protein